MDYALLRAAQKAEFWSLADEVSLMAETISDRGDRVPIPPYEFQLASCEAALIWVVCTQANADHWRRAGWASQVVSILSGGGQKAIAQPSVRLLNRKLTPMRLLSSLDTARVVVNLPRYYTTASIAISRYLGPVSELSQAPSEIRRFPLTFGTSIEVTPGAWQSIFEISVGTGDRDFGLIGVYLSAPGGIDEEVQIFQARFGLDSLRIVAYTDKPPGPGELEALIAIPNK